MKPPAKFDAIIEVAIFALKPSNISYKKKQGKSHPKQFSFQGRKVVPLSLSQRLTKPSFSSQIAQKAVPISPAPSLNSQKSPQ